MPIIDTRPASTSTTATGTTTAETCPYCGASDGVRQVTDTGRIQAWSCDRCNTDWAFTVPDTRAAVRADHRPPETINGNNPAYSNNCMHRYTTSITKLHARASALASACEAWNAKEQ